MAAADVLHHITATQKWFNLIIHVQMTCKQLPTYGIVFASRLRLKSPTSLLIFARITVRLNKMNNSSSDSCYPGLGLGFIITATLPISTVSLLPSLATVIFVCVLKLHKTPVYRMALYQVLSAVEFSVVWITASVYDLVSTYTGANFYESFSVTVQTVFEALLLGSAFIKLMFTVWIVIHLFALAVFHKNLQRLEPLYVVSSLLVPLVVTAALLGVNFTPRLQVACVLIADIVYTIIFSILVLLSVLIIVMGTILCHRACRRRSLALSEYDKQHKKALYEMLPLLLYPILFLIITTPIFATAVLNMRTGADTYTMSIIAYSNIYIVFSICGPLWSFTTSLLLIFHLCVVGHVRIQNLQRIKNALHKVRLHREAD